MNKIDAIAKEIITRIVSELPEEARTHDMVLFVLKETKEKVDGMKVKL